MNEEPRVSEELPALFELEVDDAMTTALRHTARWGRALGICIVFAALLVLISLFIFWWKFLGGMSSSELVSQPIGALIITIIIILAIIGIILFFLIRGMQRILSGLRNDDQEYLNAGFSDLKNFFGMYGVVICLATLRSIYQIFAS